MINRQRAHRLVLLAVILLAALTTACGQKGDLYLPDGDHAEEIQQEDHL